MTNQFTWIPIYQELANELTGWQNRQGELIAFLEDLRAKEHKVTILIDKDSEGNPFLMTELDPFTFFGSFNRRIKDRDRIAILSEVKRFFKLQSELPADFAGIPFLHPMSSWFVSFQGKRKPGDVERLWNVFQLALTEFPLANQGFLEAFDAALEVRKTNINLTMGLFWIRPQVFLNLDQLNRTYLGIKLPADGLSASFYLETLKLVQATGKSFPELSLEAWHSANDGDAANHKITTSQVLEQSPEYRIVDDINYWLVGAYWSDKDPADQTARFLEEGIWENGYHDRFTDEVNSMQVGDKMAIKSAATQKRGLPFDNRNKTVSRMTIKAIGTIVANRNDGRVVEVEWDDNFKEKEWYFYTNRSTLWHLKFDDDYRLKELAEKLRDFVWYDKEQDYAWFINLWWSGDDNTEPPIVVDEQVSSKPPYSMDDLLGAGVFLQEQELAELLGRLQAQKALILQGPPGVGKTFIARKIAYVLMKEKDDDRLEMVQFHQSYAYDDFVRGYRPLAGQPGTFGLQNGIFYEFCQKAGSDPDREYVFIIDEINRGNLSQIFGELLMLIEHDKRGPEFSVPLVYRTKPDEPRFYLPSNLYIIGLMNVADRSLAMVDYALRRRFAFFDLKPKFESELFSNWLQAKSMDPKLVQQIANKLSTLNRVIREDALLGENYQIGHSYFCPNGESFSQLGDDWYRSIVRTQIVPLLKEYWFDNPQKAQDAEKELLS